ncbi:MAG: RNA degradosome polyphosphate kinase, partial [Sphingomonas sp.]
MTRSLRQARLDSDDDPFEERDNERYFNRELSWLAFNRRVLEEACNTEHPLLERLRFLSISGSNLDEFFMVRVAGLKGQQLLDVEARSADGLTPSQQLSAITTEADALLASQQNVWRDIRHALSASDIEVLSSSHMDSRLSPEDMAWLETHFREQIFPVITPQALDPAHPFPFIPNAGLGVMFDLVRLSDDEPIRELVIVPNGMARFVRLPGESARYIAVESMLKRFSIMLFPGYRVDGAAEFRVLRDSDIEIEEEADDLVRYFANAIKRRRRGRVIRLELETGMPESLARVLKEELGEQALVTESGSFLGIADLGKIVDEDRPDLKFVPFTPRFPERIREFGGDCFAAISAKDIIVQHPYE